MTPSTPTPSQVPEPEKPRGMTLGQWVVVLGSLTFSAALLSLSPAFVFEMGPLVIGLHIGISLSFARGLCLLAENKVVGKFPKFIGLIPVAYWLLFLVYCFSL